MRLARELFARSMDILTSPDAFPWTVQGFGMVRTYLDPAKEWRLNVWDDRLRYVDTVSDIHDHPWSFRSWVLAGQIENQRFRHLCREEGDEPHLTHSMVEIKTGEEGGRVGPITSEILFPGPKELYVAGQDYAQNLSEVHRTVATRGCVTLNQRTPATTEYTARVFFPLGTEWVDAMPRKATAYEVHQACRAGLDAGMRSGMVL